MSAFRLYKITCSENGKVYIGYTSKTVEERFKAHLLNARWKRIGALYDAIRCYGNDAFSVEMLLECQSHEEACHEEVGLISELGSMLPNGYNMTRGGDGVPLPAERWKEVGLRKRGKISEKQLACAKKRRGVKHSPEHIAKCVEKRLGSKRSEETRRRMSEAQVGLKKGIPWTESRRNAYNRWKERRLSNASGERA